MNKQDLSLVWGIISFGGVAAILAVVGYALWGHVSIMPEHVPQKLFMPSGVTVHVTQDLWQHGVNNQQAGGEMSNAAMARFLQGGREMEFSIGGIPFRVRTDGSDSGTGTVSTAPALGVAQPETGGFRGFFGTQDFRYSRTSGDQNSGVITVTPINR